MRALVLVAFASAAWSQNWQPNLVNAQLEARHFSGNLEQQIRAVHPTWFGYTVKSMRHDGGSCCWNGASQSGCWLEENGDRRGVRANSGVPVPLEGSDAIAVLFRVSDNSVEKVQAYASSCPLDAGGLPFVWLTGVPTDASLSFLHDMVARTASKRISDGAVFAISQHEGSPALDTLIEMARQSASPHVREQALFWLAQRAGERAAATITNAIQNDPDAEVKKKAVFALSQLPSDESVPMLIQVARSQRNPEVRKQAFFWLGQSKDRRAFAFIEDVLKK